MNYPVEEFIKKSILKNTISEVDPIELLTPNRFDIAIKFLYLKTLIHNPKIAKEIYKRHLEIFGNGKYMEYGNSYKNSENAFIKEFQKLDKSIKNNGFIKAKSLIPLSKNNSAINGAHRIASAIFHKKKIFSIQTTLNDHNYDFKFFKNKFFPKKFLYEAALVFTKLKLNARVAFLWGNVFEEFDKITNKFKNVYFYDDLKLTNNGKISIIYLIYKNEVWLGNPSLISSGASDKANKCFSKSNRLRIIFFSDDKDLINFKKEIRSNYSYGKHSLHLTDTYQDTLRLAKTLLNINSLDFINKNKIVNLKKSLDENELIIKYAKERKISISDFLVSGSKTLELYGYRESRDIDLLSFYKIVKDDKKKISSHNHQSYYYKIKLEELIYDQTNYINLEGVKYVSIYNLAVFKNYRNELKDQEDLKLISKIIDSDKLFKKQLFLDFYKMLVFFLIRSKLKIFSLIVKLLKKTFFYKNLRRIYRKLVSKNK